MRSYAQYCPAAEATEVLGDRWTRLIVREMLGGASGLDELQRGLGDRFAWSSFAPASRSAQNRHRAAAGLAVPRRVRIADDGDPAT